MKPWGVATVVLLAAVACGGSSTLPRVSPPAATRSSVPSPRQASTAGLAPRHRPFAPAPGRSIPRGPLALSAALATTTRDLRAAVDRWRTEGDPSRGPAPARVQLLALYQQRIYRFLARHPAVSAAVLRAVPGWLRAEAETNLDAGRALFSLVHPVRHRPPFRLGRPEPAGVLLADDREGQRRFGVSWAILAAVNLVESKFGRVRSNSTAGAQGPMQFIPSTWAAYGMGGDVHDPRDAILGAANYLHHSGAPANDRNALYAYNHAAAYVEAVLDYAREMQRDVRAYYEYFNWQVFVVTPNGDRRLTGPGVR